MQNKLDTHNSKPRLPQFITKHQYQKIKRTAADMLQKIGCKWVFAAYKWQVWQQQ
jgi:hypothetical protein